MVGVELCPALITDPGILASNQGAPTANVAADHLPMQETQQYNREQVLDRASLGADKLQVRLSSRRLFANWFNIHGWTLEGRTAQRMQSSVMALKYDRERSLVVR